MPSAAALVVASCVDGDALLVAGIVSGAVEFGVSSADAGVFHDLCLHSPEVAGFTCEALSLSLL